MVAEILFPAVLVFVFIMLAAYGGTLRALQVYFDPEQDSIFVSEEHEPPKLR